jgi:hypothetical protein
MPELPPGEVRCALRQWRTPGLVAHGQSAKRPQALVMKATLRNKDSVRAEVMKDVCDPGAPIPPG